jgi:hypothetical protein
MWRNNSVKFEVSDKMALCSSIRLQISSDRIHYLKFILEGYDGLAILSTVDAEQGIVELRSPPETQDELKALLHDIKPQIAKNIV